MSYPKNASPEVIAEHFKQNTVRWINVFENNVVPEDIILEFKNRIFKGDCCARVTAMVKMFISNKIKLTSPELFDLILKWVDVNSFRQINSIYPIMDHFLSKSKEEIDSIKWILPKILRSVPEVNVEFLNLFASLDIPNEEKIKEIKSMLAYNIVKHEVAAEAFKIYKQIFHHSFAHASCYTAYDIDCEVFSQLEYIDLVPDNKIIEFFDSPCYSGNNGQRYATKSDLAKFNSVEIVDKVVSKIKLARADNYYVNISSDKWERTRELIKSHPDASEIDKLLSKPAERFSNLTIDWEDADREISENNLSTEIVTSLMYREDAPLWFTDKYQSKIMQLLLISNKKTAIVNDCYRGFVESFGSKSEFRHF